MRILKIVPLVMLMVLLGSFKVKAQDEKYKAAFLYQFGRILEWPSTKGDFVIAVYGESGVTPLLEAIASSKTVGTSKIVVKKISDPGGAANANIVFVSSSNQSKLSTLSSLVANKETLIVYDGKPANGAGIGFVNVGGKVLFEINKTNIKKGGLKSALSLERLASKVYE